MQGRRCLPQARLPAARMSAPPRPVTHLRAALTEQITSTTLATLLQTRFRVTSEQARPWLEQCSTTAEVHALLMSLVEPAASMAQPPISGFQVGAVGLGTSGAIYAGFNIEFPGSALNNSIHAEQCLMLNCLLHQERGLQVVAVSEAPCGHCRQFYTELNNADEVRFVFGAGSHWQQLHPSAVCQGAQPRPTAAYSLDQLLPARFGPHDLISEGESFPLLLDPQQQAVRLSEAAQRTVADRPQQQAFKQAAQQAELWAQRSYAPYSKCPSGAAIITTDGQVYAGGCVESAAFNPSLSPFHAAWVAALVGGITHFSQVQEVVLAELPGAPVQHVHGVRALLAAVAPAAHLIALPLQHTTQS